MMFVVFSIWRLRWTTTNSPMRMTMKKRTSEVSAFVSLVFTHFNLNLQIFSTTWRNPLQTTHNLDFLHARPPKKLTLPKS
jgi:hypothetical protein